MKYDNKVPVKLVKELIGKQIWGISVGPYGISMQFGKCLKEHKNGLKDGEISVRVNTKARISVGNRVILNSLFPQRKEDELMYRKFLEDQQVLQSMIYQIDKMVPQDRVMHQDNALHLLISPDITFSAIPELKVSEFCWIIYDHRIANPPGIIVYSDLIEYAL